MLLRLTLSRTVRTLLMAVALVVCLTPLRAQDIGAKVLVQTGQISVMSDSVGGDAKPLWQGMTIRPQQLIVSGPDGYAQFQVSDGSTFEVFSNARVVFRPTLANWKDLLNIGFGRVKVFIFHEPNKPNHNEVRSPTAVISVRGTAFDVDVEDSDGTTLVTVDEGLVDVVNRTAAGNPIRLSPGDVLRVFRNQPLAIVKPDRGNILRAAMNSVREAIWTAIGNRQGGGVAGVPGTTTTNGGAQGDKGKPGTGNTGKPGDTGPGTAPSAPGTPPKPPGGE
jgi:hypothetical protein